MKLSEEEIKKFLAQPEIVLKSTTQNLTNITINNMLVIKTIKTNKPGILVM
jgi:hypothetical protein